MKFILTVTPFVIFYFVILFFFIQKQIQPAIQLSADRKQILGIESQQKIGIPWRLKIPKINVDSNIQYVGLTSSGEMGIPSNTVEVGWFGLGPRPGEVGTSVIAGHFDTENGEAGVFANLYKLKTGDRLYVEDDKGIVSTFVVREIRDYFPGHDDEVFNSINGSHLNLITCDGTWNFIKKSYTKRLVVFSDLVS